MPLSLKVFSATLNDFVITARSAFDGISIGFNLSETVEPAFAHCGFSLPIASFSTSNFASFFSKFVVLFFSFLTALIAFLAFVTSLPAVANLRSHSLFNLPAKS